MAALNDGANAGPEAAADAGRSGESGEGTGAPLKVAGSELVWNPPDEEIERVLVPLPSR